MLALGVMRTVEEIVLARLAPLCATTPKVSTVYYAGSGPNDLSATATAAPHATLPTRIIVTITQATAPPQFTWQTISDSVLGAVLGPFNVAATYQLYSGGPTIAFSSHASLLRQAGDYWEFLVLPTAGLKEVSAYDFRIDSDADVQELIERWKGRAPAGFLSMPDVQAVPDDTLPANAKRDEFILSFKFATAFTDQREDERRYQDYACHDVLNYNLWRRQTAAGEFSDFDTARVGLTNVQVASRYGESVQRWTIDGFVFRGSARYRRPEMLIRVYDFAVMIRSSAINV